MEKRKKNKRLKIIKVVFAVLAVVTLICTTAINSFASVAYANDGEYVYAGNVDYTLSVHLEIDRPAISNELIQPCLSIDISPLYSNSMLNDAYTNSSEDFEAFDDAFYIYSTSFDYEATDGFINANPSNGNIWSCQYNYTSWFNYSYYLRYIQVEARDFYYYCYADEDDNLFSEFTEVIAESVLNLKSDEVYTSGGTGVIYYSEAGKENNAENRMIYEYSIGADETTYMNEGEMPYYFAVLPYDTTFDGKYSEPQLIYIEYLSFIVPVDRYVTEFRTGVHYLNLYYNFRNDDLKEFEPPITPIDPGIFADYTSWIGTAVSGFLDFQIVQGFTLGGIVMVLIAFTLCLWFLKVFAGG